MNREYRYIYAGKSYSRIELLDMLIALEKIRIKKEKWYDRIIHYIDKYSYSIGFSEGILYGLNLITSPKEYALKTIKQKAGEFKKWYVKIVEKK